MRNEKLIFSTLQQILHHINIGIHVIDKKGITILYNEAMAKLEGIERSEVMNKPILDIFPSLDEDSSTLITAMKIGRIIEQRKQTYSNYKGKSITTINTTIPLFDGENRLGAVEIAEDVTKIKELSEQVIDLQDQLITKKFKGQSITKSITKRLYTFDDIVGSSDPLKKAINLAKKASKTTSSVLIYGETGTGKELFSQSIHNESNRRSKPFIAQNCAALPETLLEGILFGTSKGGFTGAIDRPGLFEQANGGTLLLDEINSMGILLQSKLLRALQEGYIRRVGGLKDIPIDVKIIATMNENPKDAIKEGRLRKDLYYRIGVLSIEIPKLSDRKNDMKLLCDCFIKKYNKKFHKDVWMISDSTLEIFKQYEWPGNVRELQNKIESAMNMIADDEHVLKKEYFSHFFEDTHYFNRKANSEYDWILKNMNKNKSLPEVMAEIEEELITVKLSETDFNISKTAKLLNIKRQTLQHKIKKYDIKSK
ncbi:sigma 54-interacting transcriptional regulator [Clostridiaceae bacterium M8S5]|nr:sigma 54-interacting transcriptional regulator [Clostridiaceae bacterium M8S5]